MKNELIIKIVAAFVTGGAAGIAFTYCIIKMFV